MNDWKTAFISLRELRRAAYLHRDLTSTFEMLKKMGLVPEDVISLPTAHAKLDADPERLNVGYLASSAYEWDSWGPASPLEFVKAMSYETKGSTARDLIAETLTSLGRSMKAAAVA